VRWLENLKQSTAILGAPTRCIHIGDRESDIYELFSTANDVGKCTAVPPLLQPRVGSGRQARLDSRRIRIATVLVVAASVGKTPRDEAQHHQQDQHEIGR
jgi:hypothetical protein